MHDPGQSSLFQEGASTAKHLQKVLQDLEAQIAAAGGAGGTPSFAVACLACSVASLCVPCNHDIHSMHMLDELQAAASDRAAARSSKPRPKSLPKRVLPQPSAILSTDAQPKLKPVAVAAAVEQHAQPFSSHQAKPKPAVPEHVPHQAPIQLESAQERTGHPTTRTDPTRPPRRSLQALSHPLPRPSPNPPSKPLQHAHISHPSLTPAPSHPPLPGMQAHPAAGHTAAQGPAADAVAPRGRTPPPAAPRPLQPASPPPGPTQAATADKADATHSAASMPTRVKATFGPHEQDKASTPAPKPSTGNSAVALPRLDAATLRPLQPSAANAAAGPSPRAGTQSSAVQAAPAPGMPGQVGPVLGSALQNSAQRLATVQPLAAAPARPLQGQPPVAHIVSAHPAPHAADPAAAAEALPRVQTVPVGQRPPAKVIALKCPGAPCSVEFRCEISSAGMVGATSNDAMSPLVGSASDSNPLYRQRLLREQQCKTMRAFPASSLLLHAWQLARE